ncbi:hypothetical protein TWF506_008566 [Arthrobotrys conoides]|uniref:Uncharacterized protein n=1 Tax=Arthrobotrys conoides TaxID=74498 RepID=A0AAN8NW86_9PEZI
MVQLSHTAASRRAVRTCSSITEEDSASIDHTKIARIAGEHRPCEPRCALDLILRGTDIYLPEGPPKPDPSAEYLVLMQKLRHEQAEKMYATMLNIPEKDDSAHSIAKEISDQISVILNVLFSAIFTGLAICYLRKMDDAKTKAQLQPEVKSITLLENEPDT